MVRARLAALLLLASLLLCIACSDDGAQERPPAQPVARQSAAAAPSPPSTSAQTQEQSVNAAASEKTAASEEIAVSEEADDCRIDAPPDGREPLDLGTVTVHGDRPAAEARAIREGIAAVLAYHRQLGRNFRGTLHVHSYSTFFDTHRHMVAQGDDSLNVHLVLQIGWSISTDWTHDGPPATGEPRLWLVRADRLSAATALAAYLLRIAPGRGVFLDLDPLAVRGLASYVAYRALERAGFGSVESCLAAAVTAWRESGQGWLEAPVAAGLTTYRQSDSSVDDTAMLFDAADWYLPYTMRLFGALALHQLQFDPAPVFAHGHRLPRSAPELIKIDREAFESFLRQSGVIPPPRDPIDVVIRWSPDALGDRVVGAIRLEQRHYLRGAISGWRGRETPSFTARKIREAELQASGPPGTYNLLLEIGGQQVIAGVFAITPTGIKPATSDAVLRGFGITATDHEVRIGSIPSFVELELGSDPAKANDLGWRWYSLCRAGESFIWCWDPEGARSDWPATYTVPAGRYVLQLWEWVPSALVDISDTDARIVEQYHIEFPSDDGVITTDAEMAFERMDGGWRLVISERAAPAGQSED